jgi:Ca2+-binding RTX toxin-like protein
MSLSSSPAGSYNITSPGGSPIVELPGGVCGEISPNGATCPKPGQPLGYIMMFGDDGDDRMKVVGGGFPAAMTADVDGGKGSDVLNGSPGDDVLFSGHTGADTMLAGGGSDALIAEGIGGDNLQGQEGNDQLVTDDPCQSHLYSGGPGFDIAGFGRYDRAISGRGNVRATMGGTAFDPGLRGCKPTKIQSDMEILEGSAGNDILVGYTGKANLLMIGREGNDTFIGGSRPDTMSGGPGADTFLGNGGFDSIDAKDGQRDAKIDCGKGSGEAKTDGKDPKAKNCKKG